MWNWRGMLTTLGVNFLGGLEAQEKQGRKIRIGNRDRGVKTYRVLEETGNSPPNWQFSIEFQGHLKIRKFHPPSNFERSDPPYPGLQSQEKFAGEICWEIRRQFSWNSQDRIFKIHPKCALIQNLRTRKCPPSIFCRVTWCKNRALIMYMMHRVPGRLQALLLAFHH